MTRWVLTCAVLLAGCRDEKLKPGEGDLQLTPSRVQFDLVYLGETGEAFFEVQNTGRISVDVTWSVSGHQFALDAPPAALSSGEVVRVRALATPTAVGESSAVVKVATEGAFAQTTLAMVAAAVPDCSSTNPCAQSAWDKVARACVESPVTDGLVCSDVCLLDAHCVAGRCVGAERNCDDSDACTQDLCRDGLGCTHQPAPPCPGDGRCQQGVCNPLSGCALAPAPDGTVCGRTGCAVADVCIAGSCVERDPPDGFVCAEASPCQEEGRCTADVCVRAPAVPISPGWDYGAPLSDGGAPDNMFSDLFLSPSDAVTLSGYFTSAPLCDARGPSPVPLTTTARRCLDWEGVMVCADHPTSVAAGVSAIDPATGAPRWTYTNVLADLPQLVAADQHTFLARLVEMSATRLAVIFETRRVLANGADSLCRTFSVVVLDRYGQKVIAWVISDPMFSRCDHPHSYGAVSDTSGNLYFAFTPSGQTNPAEPTIDDTLFISFSEIGQLRWKGLMPKLPGGELSVARGALLHQHAVTAFSTVDGSVLGLLPGEFHLGVATRDALIPGPLAGEATLGGFLNPSLTPAWTHSLPAGEVFASDQLRLAGWTTRRDIRTVALGFTRAAGALFLLAVDTATGQKAFSCPVSLGLDPLLMEVGKAGLGLMTAYAPPLGCVICDPRYATTRNRFFWLDLPLIDRPSAPWPGNLGGAGHDHKEDWVP